MAAAESYLGVPYVWGGASRRGRRLLGADDARLASGRRRPAARGDRSGPGVRPVALYQIEPGDLLFYHFANDGPWPITHVAMYVGSGPYGTQTIIQAAEVGHERRLHLDVLAGLRLGRPALTGGRGQPRRDGPRLPSAPWTRESARDRRARPLPQPGLRGRRRSAARTRRGPPSTDPGAAGRCRHLGTIGAFQAAGPEGRKLLLRPVVPRRVGGAREDPADRWRPPDREPRRRDPGGCAHDHAGHRDRARPPGLRTGRLLVPDAAGHRDALEPGRRGPGASGQRLPAAARRRPARARVPRGDEGPRQARPRPVPAPSLRPRRLRRDGDASRRARRPDRRRRRRGVHADPVQGPGSRARRSACPTCR